MPNYTVTIDVADFVGNGIAPRLAYAVFSRAGVDSSSSEIVTSAPISVQIAQTPVTVKLEQNVPYKVRLYGVAGVTDPFYVRWNADISLAALRQLHQVAPATLLPVVDPPASVGQVLAEAMAILTGGAGGALSGQFPNPGLNLQVLDSAIAGRVADDGSDGSESATHAAVALIATAAKQAAIAAAATDATTRAAAAQLAAETAAAANTAARIADQAASDRATFPAMRATAPSASERAAGTVAYIDVSVVPPVLKGWDGTAWVSLGGSAVTTPDNAIVSDLGDYITSDTGDYLVAA